MTNVTEMPTAVITAELEAFKSKYKVPPDVALTISSVFYNTEEDTGVPARVWVAEAMKDEELANCLIDAAKKVANSEHVKPVIDKLLGREFT